MKNNWTEEEINFLLKSRKGEKIKTYREISKILGRGVNSCKVKYGKLSKKLGTYGENHRLEKYKVNELYLKKLGEENIKTILDAFSGEISYWKTKFPEIKVVTNDKNKNFNTDYNLPAEKLLKIFVDCNKKFDIIDLDPFNSPWKCFDNAIKICNKGLIMTFGDKMGLISNSRLGQDRYGVKYNEKNIIKSYINKSKKLYSKTLEPVILKKWGTTWRIYFKIKENE